MQMAIEMVYIAVQTMVYTLILYSMIGFEWTAAKFFLFYFFILTCYIYFTLYGMMLVALTPNHHLAAICMSFFLSFWNLFSGFLISRKVCNSYSIYVNSNTRFCHYVHSLCIQNSLLPTHCSKSPYGGGGTIGLLLWLGHSMVL